MPVGKKEIREEVRKRLLEHPHLLKDVTAEKLMMVIMSNIGWYWNVEDVGKTRIHIGTIYEDDSAIAGLETFIQQCMDEIKG